MQIFHIEKNFKEAVCVAVEMLRQGKVIAFPTETVYGLGCDPRNLETMERVYTIKFRETQNALPLVASDLSMVQRFFALPEKILDLVQRSWPGPLTILLEPKDADARNLFRYVTKDGAVAIRVSSHPFIQAVTREFGFPITATSANISGEPPCLSGDEVVETFADQPQDQKPDLLINGGKLPKSRPSTIIRVYQDGEIRVIRQGAVTVEPL